MDLPLHSFYASCLFDHVIDELRCVFIFHVGLLDPSLRQKLQQVWVQVIGVPSHMGYMFESTWCSNVGFGEFCTLLLLLVLFAFPGHG